MRTRRRQAKMHGHPAIWKGTRHETPIALARSSCCPYWVVGPSHVWQRIGWRFFDVLTFRIVDPPDLPPAVLVELQWAVMSAMTLVIGLVISCVAHRHAGQRADGFYDWQAVVHRSGYVTYRWSDAFGLGHHGRKRKLPNHRYVANGPNC